MPKIRSGNIEINTDSLNNPVIERIIIKEIIAVPDATMPEVNRETSIISSKDKKNVDLFSKRDETTLTGQYKVLGTAVIDKAEFEDNVTTAEFTVEYIVEAIGGGSATIKLQAYGTNTAITGSEISTGAMEGTQKFTSGALTLPVGVNIVECWGKKDSGNAVFIASRIKIERSR